MLIKIELNDNMSEVLIVNNSSRPFHASTGVRQDDALSATLLNVALNMVLEGTEENGNVYISKQICADDIVPVTRNIQTIKEILYALKTEGRKIGLRINAEKTKYAYMKMSPTQVKIYPQT
jgi:hypothetical protein